MSIANEIRRPETTLAPGRAPCAGAGRRARFRVPASRAAGFTLIEVIVSIVIFTIGILALAALVPLGSKRVSDSGVFTRASSLASEHAETLLALPYSAPDLTAGTHDDPANPHDGAYYVRWSVEDDEPIANSKRITVSVHRGAVTAPTLTQVVIATTRNGG